MGNTLDNNLVSRQAVLDIIEKEPFKGDAISEIEKLPPVTPKEKTGHWIDRSGGDPTDFSVSCNLCNKWFPQSTNFCPNCGAKMR